MHSCLVHAACTHSICRVVVLPALPCLAGFGNDGLLDIRLVVSRDNEKVGYSEAKNGRSPWVPLGVNKCGGAAHAPGNVDGWCSPATVRKAPLLKPFFY